MAPRGLQDTPSSRYLLHFARMAVLGWAGGDSRSVNNYTVLGLVLIWVQFRFAQWSLEWMLVARSLPQHRAR